MIRKSVAVLSFLLTSHLACAGLKWENTTIDLHPKATDTQVSGEFKFRNTGREQVTIESVQSGCGCTTAALDKATYEPNEKGKITATFTLGARRGLQTKLVYVRVKDEKEPVALTVNAHIPEQIKLEPEFVFWDAGEKNEPKTIKLSVVATDVPMRIAGATSNNANLEAKLETVQDGREYRILVTPRDTKVPGMAILTVEAVFEPNQRKTFQAFAQIKPPAAN